MKIDCHLHLPVRDNLQSVNAQKVFLLKELKANNIDYGIVIPDNLRESSIGNLQQCFDLFKNENRIFLIPSIQILKEPTSNINEFDSLLKNRKIVGLKIFPGHDEQYPHDIRLKPFIALCLKYDKPFVVHTGWNNGNPEAAKWNDPKYIIELGNDYPKLKIVICHYYWPKIEYCYKITRGIKNIYFDTSGLADKDVVDITGKEIIKGILEKTIVDNHSSVLFGSDFGMCDITAHIDLIDGLNISDKLKKAIYYQNAVKLYHLEIANPSDTI